MLSTPPVVDPTSSPSGRVNDQLLLDDTTVAPFGLVNDTQNRANVVLDEAMMAQEILNYHPLTNDATTTIAAEDLLTFVRACGHEPRILSVSATLDS